MPDRAELLSDRQLIIALLRRDFVSFVIRCFQTVSPGMPYVHGRYVEAIAYAVERCRHGKIRRLIINMLPRSLKSIIASVAYPAWLLGHDPTRQIICICYSADLATKHSRDCRAVMTSDWYLECFRGTRIDPTKNTETEFMTTRRGFRLATSVGGTLTGRGADTIIIDDPIKVQDADSKVLRDSTLDWFDGTLVTRLNNRQTGTIIVVMHRVHEDDLSGNLLERGNWESLILPAITEAEQHIPIGDDEVWVREPGSVIHPELETREQWDQKRTEYKSSEFQAQYQQSPIPDEGNLIKREWIKTYTVLPPRGPGVQVVQSWDIASSTAETADWSVCTTWLIFKRDYYLLHVWRGRLEFPHLRHKLIELTRAYSPNRVLIEQSGPGLHLVQEFRLNPVPGVPVPIGIKPEGDKRHRMQAQSARFEAGQVHVPADAPWLGKFLHEILGHPAVRYDDQVDSVSQFLGWAEAHHTRHSGIAFSPPRIYIDGRWYTVGVDRLP